MGPWRAKRDLAIEDAVHAGQAVRESSKRDGLLWLVVGLIESNDDPSDDDAA